MSAGKAQMQKGGKAPANAAFGPASATLDWAIFQSDPMPVASMPQMQLRTASPTVPRKPAVLKIAALGAAPLATRPPPIAEEAARRGAECARAGKLNQALTHLERATRLAPNESSYWAHLASVLRRLHRVPAAIDAACRAAALDPASETACHLLAEILRLNNRHAEALQALAALDERLPRSAKHWLLTGAIRMSLGQWQDAAVAFLQVLAQTPAEIEAYMQLGHALANLRRFGEAAECFRTVTILEPEQLGAAIYAAHYAAWACDWVQGPQDHERMVQALGHQEGKASSPSFSPFCLLSMNDDAAMHRRAAELEARRMERDVHRMTGWQPPKPGHEGPQGYPLVVKALDAGRCRIGFVSADFRTHATSMLMVQTLERLDRERFEVILYSHGKDDASPLRARMAAACDRLVECAEMSTAEQAARIRADGVAILIDMSGYTSNTRLSVFTLRPAPVQALWLAYPSTVGGSFVDYLIGDPILTPMAHAEDFAEHIAQLPLCYEPTDEKREHPEPLSRAECGLPEDCFVFACFNQSYKITEEVFSRWCRILQRVPGSVLWLLVPQEEIQTALLAQAQARGIDAQRLIFAPFVDPIDHLARLPQADLFLDTFPYGAHTTCSDALWMGLPVLTQVGRSFSARVAASLLHAAELPQMAVDGGDVYEERAVQLATEPGELEAMRDHLWTNRMDLPLFDNRRFAGEFGDLLGQLAARWRRGEAPAAIQAPPLSALAISVCEKSSPLNSKGSPRTLANA
jgi:protein O-GlcNAc transferase